MSKLALRSTMRLTTGQTPTTTTLNKKTIASRPKIDHPHKRHRFRMTDLHFLQQDGVLGAPLPAVSASLQSPKSLDMNPGPNIKMFTACDKLVINGAKHAWSEAPGCSLPYTFSWW